MALAEVQGYRGVRAREHERVLRCYLECCDLEFFECLSERSFRFCRERTCAEECLERCLRSLGVPQL